MSDLSSKRPARLLVCYVSGLDLRRVHPDSTPFLAAAAIERPLAPFVNLPSNELFPTLVTGSHPMAHGVWGVRLRTTPPNERRGSWLERLPEKLATSLQCGLHFVGKTYDLAAIPPKRRRQFAITRTKYKRRTKRAEALFGIGGLPTVFDVVGRDRSAYFFNSRYDPERSVLGHLCNRANVLEFLELYSLDRYQQWNSDRPEAVTRFYAHVDAFLRLLDGRCRAFGWSLLLVSDHGHEPIRAAHDLRKLLGTLPVGEDEYSYFLEVSNVRFWFHTEAARRAVRDLLSTIPVATTLRFDDMARHGIPLSDPSYGELFAYLDPGHIFFPHDFHHPLANLWLGLSDPMQRARLRDPRHRGNHGHLPHFEAERSFALLFDPRFEARAEGSILDIAPTLLHVLGIPPPATMVGRPLFQEKATRLPVRA
jgi:hypothetical protein